MELKDMVAGKNSVLFHSGGIDILYEKLSNTVHSDERKKLGSLQEKIESVNFRPIFETESLRKQKDSPLSIILLEITEQCNLGCSYCIYSGNYINERVESNRKMPFDIAKKAIDNLVPLSEENSLIGFYGGEPLLNMKLIKQIMEYSKKSFPSNNFTFSMTTNFFNGDKYIPDIVDNGMYVNLSLDGPKEVHDKFRITKRKHPTYDKIISNLGEIEKYSPGYVNSHFFILSTCYDPNDLGEIVKYFDNNPFFVSHINRSEQKGRISNEEFILSEDNSYLVDEYLKNILQNKDPKTLRRLFDQDLKAIALRDNKILPDKLMLNGSCYPGKKRIFVDSEGRYYPCERFGSRLSIGSVDVGIQQNLVDKTIDKFADIRNNLCGECWGERLCSPCMQYAKDPIGDISLDGLSQTCDRKKSKLVTGLFNYVKLIQSDKDISEKYFKTINPLFERGCDEHE